MGTYCYNYFSNREISVSNAYKRYASFGRGCANSKSYKSYTWSYVHEILCNTISCTDNNKSLIYLQQ